MTRMELGWEVQIGKQKTDESTSNMWSIVRKRIGQLQHGSGEGMEGIDVGNGKDCQGWQVEWSVISLGIVNNDELSMRRT